MTEDRAIMNEPLAISPGYWWVRNRETGALAIVMVRERHDARLEIFIFGNDMPMSMKEAADPDEGFEFIQRVRDVQS
jgi:hypothetical protein